MAKKVVGFIKLQVPAGKANPSPPIGPALGQRGPDVPVPVVVEPADGSVLSSSRGNAVVHFSWTQAPNAASYNVSFYKLLFNRSADNYVPTRIHSAKVFTKWVPPAWGSTARPRFSTATTRCSPCPAAPYRAAPPPPSSAGIVPSAGRPVSDRDTFSIRMRGCTT
mgnify:CR=1 FL=1